MRLFRRSRHWVSGRSRGPDRGAAAARVADLAGTLAPSSGALEQTLAEFESRSQSR
jgi:hypothetical protein